MKYQRFEFVAETQLLKKGTQKSNNYLFIKDIAT